MTATENLVDGRVEVRYYSNHTNHEPDLTECKNLPLPTSVQDEITQKFAVGIPIERIIESTSIYTVQTKYTTQYKKFI